MGSKANEAVELRGMWRQRSSGRPRWQRHAPGVLGGVVLLMVVSVALFAYRIAPCDPQEQNWESNLRPPAATPYTEGATPNWLGTDNLGRDVLSRLIHGARVSVLVGLVGTCIAVLIGVPLGLLSGYYGGILDSVIMRLSEVQSAFPFTLLVIVLVSILGPSLRTVIGVLGLTGWVVYGRLVRAEVLRLRERDFVMAARVGGATDARILFGHILPNSATPIIIAATLQMPRLMITEASLSFLGLGVPLGTPSWGAMLAQGREFLWQAWWLSVFPGLGLAIVTLAANLMGDWIRDITDPKLRGVS